MLIRLKRKKIISFLVSGNGILFSFLAKKIIRGDIRANVGCVVTENRHARVIQRASELGICCHYIEPELFASRERYDEKIMQIFKICNTDLIVTAGYRRLLTPSFVKAYRNKIINVHPSLLPSFPGLGSKLKAYEHGVKVTGCSTHFIDEGMDTGPIIMQSPVWIMDDETADILSARILNEEKRILSESVRLYCEGKIKIKGNRITILR